jgi:hypothetical protein
MTLQTRAFSLFPVTSSIAPVTLTIDASAEKVGVIMQVPKTGNWRTIWFHLSGVTGTHTLRYSVRGLGTDGNPDGTIAASGTGTAANGWFSIQLSADYAVTRGDNIAVVCDFSAYTSGGVGVTTTNVQDYLFPYVTHFTAAWAKQGRSPVVAVAYDDGTFACAPGVYPLAISDQTYNTGSTPDEIGLIFSLPYPCRVMGMSASVRQITGLPDFILYDSDGTTVLASHSVTDADFINSTTGHYLALFDTSPTLAANTNYRAVFKPTTASDVRLVYGDAPSAAALDGMPGGQASHWTQRTNAGAWTETTTRRPLISIWLDAADDGASGGGGLAANPLGGFLS